MLAVQVCMCIITCPDSIRWMNRNALRDIFVHWWFTAVCLQSSVASCSVCRPWYSHGSLSLDYYCVDFYCHLRKHVDGWIWRTNSSAVRDYPLVLNIDGACTPAPR